MWIVYLADNLHEMIRLIFSKKKKKKKRKIKIRMSSATNFAYFDFFFFFFFPKENKSWQFMWVVCHAGNSHKMSRLIFSEKKRIRMLFATIFSWNLKVSRRQILTFPKKKTGFDVSSKLSPLETISCKFKSCCLWKTRKIFQNNICWKFYPEC